MDDKETLHRRARLRELIRECFDGKLVNLLSHIEARTNKAPNQGELSAIQKDNSGKSFGDKKAKTLTTQIGLSRRWFDMPLGSCLSRREWLKDVALPMPTEAEHANSPIQTLYDSSDKATRDLIDWLLESSISNSISPGTSEKLLALLRDLSPARPKQQNTDLIKYLNREK